MPKRGPKPKPPHLKLIEGNPGKRAIPDAPQAPAEAPAEPKWSEIFEGAKQTRVRADAAAEWARIVPVLDNLGILSRLDGWLLTDYCVCAARLAQCEREITSKGLTVETYSGRVKNQALTAANQYRTAIRFYLSELGLGPSARGRLPKTAEPDDAATAHILD